MPKPWICWKAPKAPKAPEASKEVAVANRDSRSELKKFLQFKALQTKCHQRQVSLRQSQQSLKATAERWRRAAERHSSLRVLQTGAACAPRGPAAPVAASPGSPAMGTLPRTAEMWRAEAVKLRGALEERKMLNQCLRLEVDTLERAFHSLIELGDQQMADLYCIQERNASLREQQQDAHADCREQHSSYWETQALHDASPSAASVASCGTLVDEMQRTAAAMHRELGALEAQLLQSRRNADLAQQQAVVLAQQQLQAAMKPELFSSPRSHFGLLEADFAVDVEDREEMEALGRDVSIQETCCKDAPVAPVEEQGVSRDLQLPQRRSELEVAATVSPGTAAPDAPNALRAAAVVSESAPSRQHLSENQQLELSILHCKERLQQRLLKEQIAQLRLKAELQRLRGRQMPAASRDQ